MDDLYKATYSTGDVPASRTREAGEDAVRTPGGNILVADDNPENLAVLGTMLERVGYQVRVARNGKEAIESALIAPPDLFILDVHMPKLDGYATCQTLKATAALAHIPVIFLSALSDPFNKRASYEAGGIDYIEKPYSFDDVTNRIKNVLRLAWLEKRCAYLEKRCSELEEKTRGRD